MSKRIEIGIVAVILIAIGIVAGRQFAAFRNDAMSRHGSDTGIYRVTLVSADGRPAMEWSPVHGRPRTVAGCSSFKLDGRARQVCGPHVIEELAGPAGTR